MEKPTTDQIRAQLERLCAHNLLKGKKRKIATRLKLLRFLIEEYLLGRSHLLTISYIAQNCTEEKVVDENAPSQKKRRKRNALQPIVKPLIHETLIPPEPMPKKMGYPATRAQLSNLRAALEAYYKKYGFGDPILISIPGGTYVPAIERNAALDEPILDTEGHRTITEVFAAVQTRYLSWTFKAMISMSNIEPNAKLYAVIPFACYVLAPTITRLTFPKKEQKIENLIEAAKQLAPGYWETTFAEACYQVSHHRDCNRAIELFDIAADNSKGQSYGMWWHSALLASMRQFPKALHIAKAAADNSRGNIPCLIDLALIQIMADDYEGARSTIEYANHFILNDDPLWTSIAAIWFEAQDDPGKALAWLGPMIQRSKLPHWHELLEYNLLDICLLPFLQGRNGNQKAAQVTLDRFLDRLRQDDDYPTFPIAIAAIGVGRYDEAVEFLRKAAFEQYTPYALLFHIYPPLRHLRGHRGYEQLLKDLKLELPR